MRNDRRPRPESEYSRTLLIVSPNFPPISAPDLHRVRICLPHYRQFGWNPVVLSVEPSYVEGIWEPLLLETIPADVPVHRVRAVPAAWARRIGVSNLGLRAFPFLFRTGCKLIPRYGARLVFFSTTSFAVMPLGRLWKWRFRVPFVLDLQDPWVGDYYEARPRKDWPPKYRYARWLHKHLESWTVPAIDGIIAVSETYHKAVRDRHGRPPAELCRTITFPGASTDYDVVARAGCSRPHFPSGDGLVHGLYAGVLGRATERTSTGICIAFREGLKQNPNLFERVRLHFLGTDYATDARARLSFAPIAERFGVGSYVVEESHRLPYFTVLKLLRTADFLIIPGSDDPKYTASKIFPYILSRTPLVAIFHENSSAAEILQNTRAGEVVSFSSDTSAVNIAERLLPRWEALLSRLPFDPPTNWTELEPYLGRENARQQCELFDEVLGRCGEENLSVHIPLGDPAR